MVDGARSKWCFPLLLDAILFLLENDRFDLSYRRTFNQSRILQECILREVKQYYPIFFEEIVSFSEKKGRKTIFADGDDLSSLSFDMSHSLFSLKSMDRYSSSLRKGFESLQLYLECKQLQLCSVARDWSDMTLLKELLMVEPAGKSRKKYISIVSALCHHPIFHYFQLSLSQALKIIVCKSLLVFPCPAKLDLLLDSGVLSKKQKQCRSTDSVADPNIQYKDTYKFEQVPVAKSRWEDVDKGNQNYQDESSFLDSDVSDARRGKIDLVTSSRKHSLRWDDDDNASNGREDSFHSLKKRKNEFTDIMACASSVPCQSVYSTGNPSYGEPSTSSENDHENDDGQANFNHLSDDLEFLQCIYYWFDQQTVSFIGSTDPAEYYPAIVSESRDSLDDSSHSSSLSMSYEASTIDKTSPMSLEDILDALELQTFQVFKNNNLNSSSMDDFVNA